MTRLRTHPGEALRDEYLVPLGKALSVPANRNRNHARRA